jgi:hypothetical protein
MGIGGRRPIASAVRFLPVVLASLLGPASAQVGSDVWERIEARRVVATSETLALPVGRRDGRYSTVRVNVPGDPIFVRQISIVYTDGSVREVALRRLVGHGEALPTLPAREGISEIRLLVKADAVASNPIVEVLGEVSLGHLERPRPVALAQGVPPGWISLGYKRLASPDGRDTIRIGREKGRFDRLAVRAVDGIVALSSVRLLHGNGETRDYSIGRELEAGARTPELPVDPSNPLLDVVLTGRRSGAAASVEIIARYAEDYAGAEGHVRASNAGWLLLGAQPIAKLGIDRGEYLIDPRLGRIGKLRLTARNGGVDVREVVLRYWGGQVERLPVNRLLQKDETTAPFELKPAGDSDEPGLRSVVVSHPPGKSGRGDAIVEVWGQY